LHEKDLAKLRYSGLCLGVNKENTIILKESDMQDSSLIKECIEHKLFDLFGDLFISNRLRSLSISAINPNHKINNNLLKKLM